MEDFQPLSTHELKKTGFIMVIYIRQNMRSYVFMCTKINFLRVDDCYMKCLILKARETGEM